MIIGTDELAIIKILRDRNIYFNNIEATNIPPTLQVMPLESKTGTFCIRGIEEGTGKIKFFYSSDAEVEVLVSVVEGALATLKKNAVLYIPYLEYQGKYFQLLLNPTSADPLRLQVMKVAGRDVYLGCSRPAKLNSISLDIEIPCFHLGTLGSEDSEFRSIFLRISSVQPLEFEVHKVIEHKGQALIEMCAPQLYNQIKKYGYPSSSID